MQSIGKLLMKDKRGIKFKDKTVEGNRVSSLNKDFLERLNDGIVEHPLQIGELIKVLAARELVRKNHLKRVVEIGCGSGVVEKFLRHDIDNYLGIDVDEERFHGKVNDDNTFWKVLDITKEKIPEKWDLLLAFDVVEHFETKEIGLEMLSHIGDCLSKNSYAIICTPIVTEDMTLKKQCWYPDYHNYEFSLSEFLNGINKSGLELIKSYGLHYEKNEFKTVFMYNQLKNLLGHELAASVSGLFIHTGKAKVEMFILKK